MRALLARPTSLAPALVTTNRWPDRIALTDGNERLSYEVLAARVALRGSELDLRERSLVVLSGSNSVDWVITYLALLAGDHVPVLTGDRPEHVERLASTWSAAAVVQVHGRDVDLALTRARPHVVHPDLALLMSTSGSTGSPKLVRLSHRNLISNADAIGEYLAIGVNDRAITSLPLHYCYGLSVLHSHLIRGASVAVTDASVVDPCFRALMHDGGVTSVAGVPHTYDMLERAGADRIRTPSLRLLTQAGGRLAGDAVERWVGRAQGWGAEFVVMYGQTEATARMAYLPPHLAGRRPGAIGVPIPGGSMHLHRLDDDEERDDSGVGELVFRGDNVMMGYAETHHDLALGHTIDELHTGDLARFHADDGTYEIVGRRARFVKPFGLRIDLDRVEREVGHVTESDGIAVAGDDERIVAIAPEHRVRDVAAAIATISGLPPARIIVKPADEIPRTANDKVDYAAIMRGGASPQPDAPESATGVVAVFASVLGREVGPNDTFVTLGGDSLSYIECSIRLERALGTLPRDWHLLPISTLAAHTAPSRRLARVDTTVLLRAIGICLVVSTHMRLWHIPGGAHTLLAVAGYNLARFMAPLDSTRERVRSGLRTAARAAVPAMVWVGVGMALFGSYSLGTLLLVNNYVGPPTHLDDHWHFWFIEVFVHLVLIATVLLAVPQVRRVERRLTYLAPVALLVTTLVLRMEWAQAGDWYNLRFRTHGVAWFFVLGWVINQSQARWQRIATTVLCLAIVPGFFRIDRRDWMIALALVALVWLRDVPFPKVAIRPIGMLASASMWIYISHFTIWPPLDAVLVREVAYVFTVAAGVVVWVMADRLLGLLNTRRQRGFNPPARPLEARLDRA